MKHTTHKLSQEQKKELFYKYQDLIGLIYILDCMALRKQLKQLYHIISGIDEITIDFYIADLIQHGFLINHKVTGPSRTTMLYLSKYPRSLFTGKSSGDVPALCFSKQKLMSQIFKIDFVIDVIIPFMKANEWPLSIEYINGTISWFGTNLFLSPSQSNNAIFYERFKDCCTNHGYTLSNYFDRDYQIAQFEQGQFILEKSGTPAQEVLQLKKERQVEADSYRSEIEKNKYLYNLNNLSGHNLYFMGFNATDNNIMNIAVFDHMNTLQVKKLWEQLGYTLLMMKRYTNNQNLRLQVNIYTWDEERVTHLQNEEKKQAYDFYRQEWVTENKTQQILKNIGILPSNWDDIQTTYISNNIYEMYNLSYI